MGAYGVADLDEHARTYLVRPHLGVEALYGRARVSDYYNARIVARLICQDVSGEHFSAIGVAEQGANAVLSGRWPTALEKNQAYPQRSAWTQS